MPDLPKTCRYCKETINAAAKVCPHCCRALGPYATAAYSLLPVIIVSAVLFPMWAFSRSSVLNEEPFVEHANDLRIAESTIHYGTEQTCDASATISTIGTIRNSGDIPWENLQLEVRYFDPAGTLIDTESSMEYGLVVPAQGESAFCIRASADKPREAYASHEVFIKGASDARSGF